MKADELSLKLKQKPKDYVIKPQANELSKSAVWKSFGIVFEKRARDGSEDFDEVVNNNKKCTVFITDWI